MKRVVLCRPAGPRNVGMILRIVENFGPCELVLVNPVRPALLVHPEFEQMSHGVEDALRKETRFLVRHLGQMESYERGWTDRAVRRFYVQCAKHWDALISLACADITTKHADRRRAHRARMKEVDERAKKIAKEDAKLPSLPKGLGSILIEQLKITPGPQLGQWMNQLKEAVEAGELPPRAEPEVYVEHLRGKLG